MLAFLGISNFNAALAEEEIENESQKKTIPAFQPIVTFSAVASYQNRTNYKNFVSSNTIKHDKDMTYLYRDGYALGAGVRYNYSEYLSADLILSTAQMDLKVTDPSDQYIESVQRLLGIVGNVYYFPIYYAGVFAGGRGLFQPSVRGDTHSIDFRYGIVGRANERLFVKLFGNVGYAHASLSNGKLKTSGGSSSGSSSGMGNDFANSTDTIFTDIGIEFDVSF